MADEVKTMWQSGIWQLAEYDIILLHILILIVRLNTTWTSGNWWNGHLATGGIWHYYIANWLIVGWGYLYSIVPLFGTGMWVEWLFIVPPLGVMLIGIFLIHSHPWKQCFPCLPITSYISNLLHPWKQCFPCLPPIQLRYVIRNSNQLRMWHFQLHFIYIVGRWLVIESYFGWEMIGQVRHGVVAWYVYQVNYPNSVHLPFKLLLMIDHRKKVPVRRWSSPCQTMSMDVSSPTGHWTLHKCYLLWLLQPHFCSICHNNDRETEWQYDLMAE